MTSQTGVLNPEPEAPPEGEPPAPNYMASREALLTSLLTTCNSAVGPNANLARDDVYFVIKQLLRRFAG